MIFDEDDHIEHFGVKGMKWGVRRAQSRDARTKRIKSGEATIRDRLIREVDLDGGRTEAIRKGELPSPSRTQKVGQAAAAGVLLAYGAYTLSQIRKG